MTPLSVTKLSRRELLRVGCTTALGLALVGCGSPQNYKSARVRFNSFVSISGDNSVLITVPDLEMGQNVLTTLAKIVADELGADWNGIEARIGGGDPVFANPLKGYQATGRSQSVRGFYQPLRSLGASLRIMLTQAAAQRWGVSEADCRTSDSQVLHEKSGRRIAFAELAEFAASLAVPEDPVLRPDSELTLIGKTTARLDSACKSTGKAVFTIDLDLPDMLTATLSHSPVLGSRVKSVVNRDVLLAAPGVHNVVAGDDFVAVVAERFYQAKKALDSAKIEISGGEDNCVSTAEYRASLFDALDSSGGIVIEDAPSASPVDDTVVATYWAPLLAHATMEPMSCVARFENDRLELWAPTQGPFLARAEVAKSLQIDPDAITIHRPFAGGGFGRRYFYDFCVQAALIAQSTPGRPIKLIWTREEDMRNDFYRPAVAARLTGSINNEGRLIGFSANIATASILETNAPGALNGKPDRSVFSGLFDNAYDALGKRLVWHRYFTPVRIGMWRSVAHSQNAFFLETLIDECASKANRDPAQFRLTLCGENRRLRAVIEKAMEVSNWNQAERDGRTVGIAAAESYGSYVAQVAELIVESGAVSVERVWCVVDCGQAIDPGGVEAQMQGGIIYGLTAALHGEITIEKGVVEQTNFHNYRMLTLAQSPTITVEIINSGNDLGGVGEPGLPPIAPAVGNAIFAATGHRLRELPFRIPTD